MTDPDEKTKPGPTVVSGEVPRKLGHLDESGPRQRSSALHDATVTAVTAALENAVGSGSRVSVMVRGDPSRALPVRIVEGVVRAVEVMADGRQRVRITVADDVEQLVLVDRIMRVSRVT